MTTRRLFSFILFIAILGITATTATDPDMWWHLRTGQYILQNGIPYHDVFSYTVPDHIWITHEWLSQVIMWGIYSLGGFPALIVVFSLLISLSLGITYRVSPGRPYVAGFVVIVAAATASGLWGVRPQMFNLLFLAIFLFVIEKYRDRVRTTEQSPWWIWTLVPLTIVWVNLHSGYLLGIVVIATYAIGDLLNRRLIPDDDRALPTRLAVRLLGVAAASFIASAVNPNGWAMWRYPFDTLGSPVMQTRIVEWFSPDFHNPYNLPFVLMLAAGVIGFVVSPRKPTITDFLLFGGTGFATMVSVRHMPLFALVAMPIVSRYLTEWVSTTRLGGLVLNTPPLRSPTRLMLTVNACIAVVALLFPFIQWANVIKDNQELVSQRYPVEAVKFLQTEGLADQPLFNSYNFGGYLIWHEIPVFVDGRADVYGDEFLRRALSVTDITAQWREVLEEYGVRVIMIESDTRLVTLLHETNGWNEVYKDDIATIFVQE